ncbi:hypothetical protein EG68_10865 [Paragonimus skrjabini miyazakii]|uniref:Charged multivesicular body protein 7 n=1 Tax=Paragonimus skrjabini miyazakii TaxID=59628 RepID=A0A8S9YBS9_9TREM|nr:hypothetical protein EG68_10865 [Paragonimus skrjabini miyazakii]
MCMSAQCPPFILPDVWEDDDEMFNLMQPIRRPQHADPVTYNHKINFWSDLIMKYAKEQRVLVVNVRALQSVFSRYFTEEGIHMSPACLKEVMKILLKLNLVQPHIEQDGFLLSLIKTGVHYLVDVPLRYTIQFALGSEYIKDNPEDDLDKQFVFHKLAEDFVEKFVAYFNDTFQNKRLTMRLPVYELNDLECALATFFPHEATRSYIRRQCIERYRCIRIENVHDSEDCWNTQIAWVSESHLVTVPKASSLESEKTELAFLTGLAHLRDAIRRQEAEEKKLIAEIEERHSCIKVFMKDKRIREAKNLLQRTKILEHSLKKKQSQLQNLEAMRLQLDCTSDNQSVLRALANSNRALKRLTGGAEGLSKVEDTMSELAESVQESNEISDLIDSFGKTSLGNLDEDQLEMELRDLLKPDKPSSPARKPAQTRHEPTDALEAELNSLSLSDLDLPDVPDVSESSSADKKMATSVPTM